MRHDGDTGVPGSGWDRMRSVDGARLPHGSNESRTNPTLPEDLDVGVRPLADVCKPIHGRAMKALLITMLLAGCSAPSNEVAIADNVERPTSANAADSIELAPAPEKPLGAAGISSRGNAQQVEAAIERDMNHLFREVPESITLAGSEWTRVDRRSLASLVDGARIHDPDCDDEGGLVCDEVFLKDGKYLRSLAGGKWDVGKYEIVGHHYCVRVRGKPGRCFGILQNADWIELRFELNVKQPGPRWVQVLPATRGGMVYP